MSNLWPLWDELDRRLRALTDDPINLEMIDARVYGVALAFIKMDATEEQLAEIAALNALMDNPK